MAFQDHFSGHSRAYVEFRPRYPGELFHYLASLAPGHECAWDCGTGNGQAAIALAQYFREVMATDPSVSQLAHAEPHTRVRYLVATAEACPLADCSVDLITVAQALHWFDIELFYQQVRRIGRPGSIFAAWSYGLARISPEVDQIVGYLYDDVLGTYWPPERKMTDEEYKTIPFSFGELVCPNFAMVAQWNLDQLVGYLGTWSSTQRFKRRRGTDPLEQVEGELRVAWGPSDRLRSVHWPLYLRVGRVA